MSDLVSEIAEIACLVHGKGEFALFKVYMDESGIHAGSPVCVVAGFLAGLKRCESFEYAWKKLLIRHRVDYFHSKEFNQLSGHFHDWEPHQQSEFEADALATIARSMNDGGCLIVGAAVSNKTFFDLSLDERNWLTGGIQEEGQVEPERCSQ